MTDPLIDLDQRCRQALTHKHMRGSDYAAMSDDFKRLAEALTPLRPFVNAALKYEAWLKTKPEGGNR